MELDGRVALVTGADNRIGKAIALAYGKAGADVVVNDGANPDAAQDVTKQIEAMGRRALTVKADINNPEQVAGMVNKAIAEFGRIDILVNNAGMQVKKTFADLSSDDLSKILSVDLRGTFLTTLYTVHEMIKRKFGRIINVTSIQRCLGKPESVHHCVAETAVGMLTKTLAAELAPHGIKINAIAPGEFTSQANYTAFSNSEASRKVLDKIPLKRVGSLKEVANLACYLASDGGDYVPGSTYVIDCGLLH